MAPKWLFWPAPSVGDVTPDAVNWIDKLGNAEDWVSTEYATVSGINTTISLSVSWVVTTGSFSLRYRIGVNPFVNLTTNPQTITVNNNNQILFQLLSVDPFTEARADITVTNASDSNTILDTFSITAEV
jgi:hypothetical protein